MILIRKILFYISLVIKLGRKILQTIEPNYSKLVVLKCSIVQSKIIEIETSIGKLCKLYVNAYNNAIGALYCYVQCGLI